MTLTAENMAERRSGIGASEIAAVCGLSPWASPLSVYEAKLRPQAPREETEDMERGNRLEGAILEWTAARTGLLVRPNDVLARSAEHPWCISTPDGYAYERTDLSRACALVEAKAPGRTQGDWTDPDVDPEGVPEYYVVQAQWQMASTGIDRVIVAALVWGRLWLYEVRRNADLQAALLERGAEFWRMVEARTPPPPSHPSDSALLSRLVRQTSDALVVPAPDAEGELLAAAIEYRRASDAIKAAEEVKDVAAAKLKAAIGEGAGVDLGAVKVSWRANKPTASTDWAAVAAELNPPAEVVARHTVVASRARPLRVTAKKEK